MATSEAVPFAKTGGLADVCGALPIELARLGHRVALIMPAYRQVFQSGQRIDQTNVRFDIPIGNRIASGRLLQSHLADGSVPVYLVEQEDFFDRIGVYNENGKDYRDNCQRFVFFCRAVMETIRLTGMQVDILHLNDWPTGLIPAYLDIEYRGVQGFENIASLLTIHNLAYQGRFWHWDMLLTGLDWKYFNWHQMEFHGDLNLLKTGIVFADAISTVSPRYAEEIQTAPSGCGLEGVLHQRRSVLSGIINGVDYDVWNPATDPAIAAKYDINTWKTGKAACKRALQEGLGLPQRKDVPLVGIVSRLVEQKGIDLVAPILETWAAHLPAQWAILGSGAPQYEDRLGQIARAYPAKVAIRLEFNSDLAHAIEAGADIFLMPSRFEPCGLNQLYSLKYGTVPVVHKVGGLADTITDAGPEELAAGRANGFSFTEYTSSALDQVLRRACQTYERQPDVWDQLVRCGMQQDWSWKSSARKYVKLYQDTIARVKQTVCA
jgi:starch synthase